MEICRHNDQIEISELDPFLAERRFPQAPAQTELAEQRLFVPNEWKRTGALRGNWEQYVKPELRRLFQSAEPKPWLPI